MSQQPALPREIAGVRLPDSSLTQKAVDLAVDIFRFDADGKIVEYRDVQPAPATAQNAKTMF